MVEKTAAPFFREEQKMSQKWIWLILGFLGIGAWYLFIKQIILKEPVGTNPAPDIIVWIVLIVFGIIFPVLFHSMKLIVEVRENSVYIHFFPFYRKFILIENIRSYYVRTYKPIREYGGWGIRWSPAKGWAYNASGNRGVQLELLDGSKILIGSQKPEELFMAIDFRVKNRS
jgi:hypothetical protein